MRDRKLPPFAGGYAIALAAGLVAAPASAHHSFAAYNMNKIAAAAGTLKEFRWGAPHSSLVLTYTDADGKPAEMVINSGSPLMFVNQGFQPRDFHGGDKISITYHPYIDGARGGALATLTLPNGHIFSDSEADRAALGAANAGGAPSAPPSGN